MHACMQKCVEELLSVNAKEGSKENLFSLYSVYTCILAEVASCEPLIGFTH